MKTTNKKALIIGASGQDGKILSDFLTQRHYQIIGVDQKENLLSKSKQINIDINQPRAVFRLIKNTQPREIYYLAAFHHSSQSKAKSPAAELQESYKTNVLSFLNFLEGIRRYSPQTKIFYASSSLIFGNGQKKKQTEKTPYNPTSAYGLTKMDGTLLCQLYREKYGLFAAAGILYNHESSFRSEDFISMKIIKSALRIKNGEQKKLIVGDLKASVDWGYAPDYVRAMYLILNSPSAADFIIATGKAHTVLDFIKIVFNYLGLDWKKYVIEDRGLITPQRRMLIGDSRKLRQTTGWRPSVDFVTMIKTIIGKLA